MRRRIVWMAIVLAGILAGGEPLMAQTLPDDVKQFDIAPQALDSALLEFSEQANLQLVVAGNLVESKKTHGFFGEETAEHVLAALLDETSLMFIAVGATVTITDNDSKELSEPKDGNKTRESETDAKPDEADRQDSRTGNGSLQEEAEKDQEAGPLEIGPQVVTGTRLNRPPSELTANVLILTAADLARFGEATLERVLQQLPQNVGGTSDFGGANSTSETSPGLGSRFGLGRLNGTANVSGASTVNLRGLGERATLILVDGKRIGSSGLLGGFSDISSIPLALVKRVEIQFDGASAIYGPDAVGGVVNVILKKDFEGVHGSLRHTAPTGGGFGEQTLSLSGTQGWGSGSLTGTLNYFRTSSQDATRSGLDLARALGYYTDYGTIRAQRSYGNPDAEISPALTQAAMDSGRIGPGEVVSSASPPSGQDGTGLTAADFLATANSPLFDETRETGLSLIPGSKRYNVRLDLSQEFPGGAQLTAALQYAPRETNSTNPNHNLDLQMPAANPYNPLPDVPFIRVSKKITGFPDTTVEASGDSWTADLALDGTMDMGLSGWEWHIGARHSRNELETTIRDELRRDEISAALRGQTVLDEAGAFAGSFNRRPRDDGEFLNPFGESLQAVNPADMLTGFLRPTQVNETLTELTTLEGYMRGEVARLPAGNMQLVAGVERRNESLGFSFRTTDTDQTLVTNGANIVGFSNAEDLEERKTSRQTSAGYLELYVPVLAGLPGVRLLSVTAAGRAESSGQYSYRTWQAGVAWQVFRGFRFRASKATSFVTPPLVTQAPVSVPPSRPWLVVDHGQFVFGSPAVLVEGANPELRPEHGSVYSYGLEWTPAFAARLNVGVNFSHSALYDRINRPPILGLFAFVTEALETRFPDVVTRNAEGVITHLDLRSVNVAFEERSSIDYRVDYRWETGFGDLGAQFNVSRTRYHNTLHTQHDAEYNPDALDKLVGEIIPKHSQRAAIYWEQNGLNLGLNFHHRSDTGFEDGDGRFVRSVPPLITNFIGSYDFAGDLFEAPGFLRNVVIDFGVNNVARKFTRRVVDGEDDNSRVAGLFNSSRGRTFYVQLRGLF